MRTWTAARVRRLISWTLVGLVGSTITIVWLGYNGTVAWERSAAILSERRAAEMANLAVTALVRDMRAVQGIIASRSADFAGEPSRRARSLVASTFARYPYPEWFFSWQGHRADSVVFFGRADRLPAWFAKRLDRSPFPVIIGEAPLVAASLVSRISRDVAVGRHTSIFDFRVADTDYQVVAHLTYRDEFDEDLQVASGFAVNLSWARQHYLPELVSQISRVDGSPSEWSISVTLQAHEPVGGGSRDASSGQRLLPMMFFDPLLLGANPPADLTRETVTIQASARTDPMRAVKRGVRWSFAVAGLALGVFTLGLLLIARAVEKDADLTERRSELVSTVTHELKTPLATIRAIGETFESGWISGEAARRDYAGILVREAKRLTRLIDTMLAYARITDVTRVYSFESLSVMELVERALEDFLPQLTAEHFDVQMDLPPDLPMIRADPTAMALLLDNLVANAIHYSRSVRVLRVSAREQRGFIVIDITDHGAGISPEEIKHVTEKCFRGREAGPGGSGLGLAIANRIVSDHGGSLAITSRVNVGTTVSVSFPAIPGENANEWTDSGGRGRYRPRASSM